MIVSEDLKSYFEKARTWEQDRLLAAHRSRRIAWISGFRRQHGRDRGGWGRCGPHTP